jgi:hypothetical protein
MRAVMKVGPRGGQIVGYQHGDITKPIYKRGDDGTIAPHPLERNSSEWVYDLEHDRYSLYRDGNTVLVWSKKEWRDDGPVTMHRIKIELPDGTAAHNALWSTTAGAPKPTP